MQKWFTLFWPMETSFAPQFCYQLYAGLTVNQWYVQSVRIGTTLFQIIVKNLYWFDSILVFGTEFSEYFWTKLTGELIHWLLLVFVMGSQTESLFMYLFANATLIVIYELKLFHLWLASKPKQNIFNINLGKVDLGQFIRSVVVLHQAILHTLLLLLNWNSNPRVYYLHKWFCIPYEQSKYKHFWSKTSWAALHHKQGIKNLSLINIEVFCLCL